MKQEQTFVLGKGEKIIKEAERLQYAGPTITSIGTGLGSNMGGGLGGGIFSSKQIKREGSIFDAKPTHVYLTNKRIVFCNAKFSLFGGTEKSVGIPFSEIEYKNIRGVNPSSKLANPAIDLSVIGKDGMDLVKFWLLGTQGKRGVERDELLALIKKQL